MERIYLAAHPDDAVLSCGGAMHRYAAAGDAVRVLTVFAGDTPPAEALSPFARFQHAAWGDPPRPMYLRRAEGQAALARLGVAGVYLDWPDAVYRTAPDGAWLYDREEALWADPHPADPAAQDGAQALAAQLAARIPTGEAVQVYAPLAVGNHVDHQIVRLAARRLAEAGYRLAFYEDYPYAGEPEAVAQTLRALGGDWQAELLPLAAADVAAQVQAIGYHRSQMRILFGGAEAMPNRMWRFAVACAGGRGLAERVWRVK